MRNHTWEYVFVVLILLISFGCSSSKSQAPVVPTGDSVPVAEKGDGHNVLLSGTFTIDPVTGEIKDVPDRNPEFHYNITGFIGNNFKYAITHWAPPNISIKMTLTNPTALQVYDVRIIFTGLYGKTVTNADGYTNYLRDTSGPAYNPFIYFAKEYDHQKFPVGPGAKDDEMLEIYWPGGSSLNTTYKIECCLGGNAEEPYKIDTISTAGSLTPSGGAVTLSASIWDWQSDITSVKILANDFYPTDLPMYKFRNTNGYIGTLMNKTGVTAGNHVIWIKAESNSPLSIALWQPYIINVPAASNQAPKFSVLPFSTRENISKGLFTYLNGGAQDPESEALDFFWEQISPVSPTGTFSGTGGQTVPFTRWDPPQVTADTQYLFRISATEHTTGKVARAVVALNDKTPLPPLITEAAKMYPSPINENHEGQFGVNAVDPIAPTEFAPFKYVWEQVSPSSPQGVWDGTSNGQSQYCLWIAPAVSTDTVFKFRVSITKDWVSPYMITTQDVEFTVKNTD